MLSKPDEECTSYFLWLLTLVDAVMVQATFGESNGVHIDINWEISTSIAKNVLTAKKGKPAKIRFLRHHHETKGTVFVLLQNVYQMVRLSAIFLIKVRMPRCTSKACLNSRCPIHRKWVTPTSTILATPPPAMSPYTNASKDSWLAGGEGLTSSCVGLRVHFPQVGTIGEVGPETWQAAGNNHLSWLTPTPAFVPDYTIADGFLPVGTYIIISYLP